MVNELLRQVADNHVVRYVPPELMNDNEVVRRRWKEQYRPLGGLVVGADQEDPTKVGHAHMLRSATVDGAQCFHILIHRHQPVSIATDDLHPTTPSAPAGD